MNNLFRFNKYFTIFGLFSLIIFYFVFEYPDSDYTSSKRFKRSEILIDNGMNEKLRITFKSSELETDEFSFLPNENRWIRMYSDSFYVNVYDENGSILDKHTIELEKNKIYIYNPLNKNSNLKGVAVYGLSYGANEEFINGKLIPIERYDYILERPPYSISLPSHVKSSSRTYIY